MFVMFFCVWYSRPVKTSIWLIVFQINCIVTDFRQVWAINYWKTTPVNLFLSLVLSAFTSCWMVLLLQDGQLLRTIECSWKTDPVTIMYGPDFFFIIFVALLKFNTVLWNFFKWLLAWVIYHYAFIFDLSAFLMSLFLFNYFRFSYLWGQSNGSGVEHTSSSSRKFRLNYAHMATHNLP